MSLINYDEIFSFVFSVSKKYSELYEIIKNEYLCASKKNNIFIEFLIKIISKIFYPKRKKIKYFFFHRKYKDLILSLPKDEVCVLGGAKTLLFCLRHGRCFMSAMSLWKVLYKGLLKENSNKNKNDVMLEIKKISKLFKENSVSESFLIVSNDCLPTERVVVNAAKIAGMKTICIQHGIFQRKSTCNESDGKFVDFFFSFSDDQGEFLVDRGIPRNKIITMGHHSNIYSSKNKSKGNRRKVCFLGQSWQIDKTLCAHYLNIYQRIASICDKNGLSIDFKPHPRERKSSHLLQIKDVKIMSMSEAIERYDVFISLNSTALLETSYAGKISIQIIDDMFESDDFSCFSDVISIEYESDSFEKDFYCSVVNSNYPDYKKEDSVDQRFLNALRKCHSY